MHPPTPGKAAERPDGSRIDASLVGRPAATGGPLTVSFSQSAAPERGAALIPASSSNSSLSASVLLQLNDPVAADLKGVLAQIAPQSPGGSVHDGVLAGTRTTIGSRRASVLLSYEPRAANRVLRRVCPKRKASAPNRIVPGGHWMADEVSRWETVLFEEYSAASIARCIARAQGALATLRSVPLRGRDREPVRQPIEQCAELKSANTRPPPGSEIRKPVADQARPSSPDRADARLEIVAKALAALRVALRLNPSWMHLAPVRGRTIDAIGPTRAPALAAFRPADLFDLLRDKALAAAECSVSCASGLARQQRHGV